MIILNFSSLPRAMAQSFLFNFFFLVTYLAIEPVEMIEPVQAGPVLSNIAVQRVSSSPQSSFLRYPGIRTLFQLPNDPFLEQQWYFHNNGQVDSQGQDGLAGADIKIFPALEIFQPRGEVVLAVIDSGLDLNHEDISPDALWVNVGESGLDDQGRDRATNGLDDDGNGYVDDVHGWNLVAGKHDVQDRHYHGTHVGAILTALTNNNVGMAGGFSSIKLMLLKIFDLGGTADRPKIAEGIRYACENGARVVNASWGSGYRSDEIEAAIRFCHERGVLFVGAAGNSRKNMDVEPDFPSAYDLPNQVVVSATDNQDRPATFSNYGTMIDIAAPGSYIFSLLPKSQYRAFSGTSQASPMVAGAAALLMAQEPWLSHMEVKKRLLESADQRRALKRWVPSAGRLNVYNLLAGKKGDQLVPIEIPQWKEKDYSLESPHPYAYNMDETYEITVPGASFLRLHFEKFQFDKHDDTLTLISAKGEVIEHLNSSLGSFWSEPIPGEKVILRLRSNDKVNDWGFVINKLQFH